MRTRSRSKGAKRGRKPPERYGTSSEGERGPSPKGKQKVPPKRGQGREQGSTKLQATQKQKQKAKNHLKKGRRQTSRKKEHHQQEARVALGPCINWHMQICPRDM